LTGVDKEGKMKILKQRNGYLLRLDKGEDVKEAVESFARDEGIGGAFLIGLGAVKDPEVGHFDPEKKVYSKRVLEGFWEVGSLTGNISLLDGSPFAHLHVAVSGPSLQAYTGHLFSGKVSVTAEIFVFPGDGAWERPRDEKSGFNFLLG